VVALRKRKRIPKDVLAQLRHVKVLNPEIDIRCFPDFMILGPQRTGTTWLYHNLEKHPRILMAYPREISYTREIHYFSRLRSPHEQVHQSNDIGWYLSYFHDTPADRLRKNLRALRLYRELYRPSVRGEASASYAVQDEEIIREIVMLNPDIKAIMLIRNPITRAWSHAKLVLLRLARKQRADVPDAEFERFFHAYRNRGEYTALIDTWSSLLKEGHLFIGAFDDIRNSPEELLLRTFAFLGVKRDRKYVGELARTRINPTKEMKLPEKWRTLLQEMYADEMKRLEERFGYSWEL